MQNSNIRPRVYCRYIDDTFAEVRNLDHLKELKSEFEKQSCLKFTYEVNQNNSLPFLDTLVTKAADEYKTSVYVKETNMGTCMNGISECPKRYKDSVIHAYVRRAITHSSSWTAMHDELQRSTQVLVNNGYSINDVQRITQRQLDKVMAPRNDEIPTERHPIKLFYRNFMSSAYKTDERILKDIVRRGVHPVDQEDKLEMVIYYRNRKINNLIMKNNQNEKTGDLGRTGVIYQYTCQTGDCKLQNISYIGMCTTTLSRRLTCHLQSGTPKNHSLQEHGTPLTREALVENTIILDASADKRRLQIKEALYISTRKPTMNIQIGSTSIPLPSQNRLQ